MGTKELQGGVLTGAEPRGHATEVYCDQPWQWKSGVSKDRGDLGIEH
jgi:hypothetical protein